MSTVLKNVTDVSLHLKTPRSRVTRELDDYRGHVQLELPAIVPGEPLTLQWRVVADGITGHVPERLNVRFFLDDILVHERADVVGEAASVGWLSRHGGTRNLQREVITIGDPAIARRLYRIPDAQAVRRLRLRVEVRASAHGEVTHAGAGDVTLSREAVDASWWEWRSAAFESIAWKTAYHLVGDFVSHLRFARVELVTVELSEVRAEDDPAIDPCAYHPVQVQAGNLVAPGARTAFSFALMHEWKWIMSASYLIVGPINKTFAYAVWFYFTDEFGNLYAGHCSGRRVRHVGVPEGKRLAGVAAQTAAANAAFWAGFMTWPIAAGWYAVAAAMGYIAKDPPAPDLAFFDEVSPTAPLMPALPDAARSAFPATIEMLELAAELASLENARTLVRAKLMGARIMDEVRALEGQANTYATFEQRMRDIAKRLEHLMPKVRDEAEREASFEASVREPTLDLLAEEGLPPAYRRLLHKHEVDPALANGLAAVCASADCVALARENGLSLVPFVGSLIGFIDKVCDERERIIGQGEVYLAPPRATAAVPHMVARMRSTLRSANAAVDSAGLATSESGNSAESITYRPG